MDNDQSILAEKIQMSDQEEQELADGMALYEMTKTSPGWQIVQKMLEDLAFHSWVDPREAPSKAEWEWRELNGFHAANNARELLENITKKISQADYLDKVKKGEITKRRMSV